MPILTSKIVLDKSVDLINQYIDKLQQANISDLPLYISQLRKVLINQLVEEYDYHFTDETVRVVDLELIKVIVDESQKGTQWFMRHGEQDAGTETDKIVKMRLPHNLEDPITITSAIEFLSTMLIFKFIQLKYGTRFYLHTSNNMRAVQPMRALTTLLTGDSQNCICLRQLNCENYPSEEDIPSAVLKTYLNDKNGVDWGVDNQLAIDTVFGKGAYKNIVANMISLRINKPPTNTVDVFMTHTQQISEIGKVARLANYGFVSLDKSDKCVVLQHGLYHEHNTLPLAQCVNQQRDDVKQNNQSLMFI